MLPDFLCHDALADCRLVRVLPGWAPQTKFGSLISRVHGLLRNQVLLDFLRQQLVIA